MQAGLAAQLEMQAIYDLVGDKIREIFAAQVVGIAIIDPLTGLRRIPHLFERGQRVEVPDALPTAERSGFGPHVRSTGETLFINGDMARWMAEYGEVTEQGETPKSAMWVPCAWAAAERRLDHGAEPGCRRRFHRRRSAAVADAGRQHGRGAENARLFAETQRLLKETEARNAELAVINSIQQGVGAELNFQAIVDLVGDKLREVFATGNIMITWRRRRGADAPHPLLVRARRAPRAAVGARPVAAPDRPSLAAAPAGVIRNRADFDAMALHHFPGTDMSRSSVLVPMFAGDRFLGSIIMENYEREDAFSEAQVRLLATVASSTGVALENARLFDETQRRARESQALSEVGRDLSSSLDLATVMDRIAGHARELLRASNSAIFLPDATAARIARSWPWRDRRCDPVDRDRGRRRHHRQPAAERPAGVHQRHRERSRAPCRSPARRASPMSA